MARTRGIIFLQAGLRTFKQPLKMQKQGMDGVKLELYKIGWCRKN